MVVRVYIALSFTVSRQNIIQTYRRNTVPPLSIQRATSKPQYHEAKIPMWTV